MLPAIEAGTGGSFNFTVGNCDRSIGARISGEIARRYGNLGMENSPVVMNLIGTADEPTSALDVTVQLQVLAILDKLVAERGMGLIFVSHDLRLVSSFCDRILVMYAGKVVEELRANEHEGGLAEALKCAKHPYTRGLMACLPQLGQSTHPLATLDRQTDWLL